MDVQSSNNDMAFNVRKGHAEVGMVGFSWPPP
jgi:hypothetical protein